MEAAILEAAKYLGSAALAFLIMFLWNREKDKRITKLEADKDQLNDLLRNEIRNSAEWLIKFLGEIPPNRNLP